ncbi:hypothetical protein [Actinoplanes regularis]|uniref:hypothetical protein n=1 Tax=Actinoplanes regularis TaxID=52697 RepID=UPI001FD5FDAC|nr:hypothetical protein [Actinoplanes regularis]
MGDAWDPHVHVEVNLTRAGADVRNLLASTFGLVADLPAEVETGCGRRVAYARTSPHPERVTCLTCRRHASEQHRQFAEDLASMFRMPGVLDVHGADAAKAVARHRDLARRFASAD